jgi:hypothetical protein
VELGNWGIGAVGWLEKYHPVLRYHRWRALNSRQAYFAANSQKLGHGIEFTCE